MKFVKAPSTGLWLIIPSGLRGLPDVTARAIMDDFTLIGPPDEVFLAYDRYVARTRALHVHVNASKTVIQCPHGPPSSDIAF